MSKLFYDIILEEEYDQEGQPYQERIMSDDHFEKIKNWLPKEFNKCEIHKAFDGSLKDKVKSCTMRCIRTQKPGQPDLVPVARITIEFIPGFRLNDLKRISCWDQMDAQMTDGFGESYDKAKIPDADGWQLKF